VDKSKVYKVLEIVYQDSSIIDHVQKLLRITTDLSILLSTGMRRIIFQDPNASRTARFRLWMAEK